MEISNIEIMEDENIEALNRILKDKNIRIEREDDFEDIYSEYRVFENDEMIFYTIYPKELLVKVAQLIPESEVRLGIYKVCAGPDNVDLSQETLVIKI
jgi:hypothetical protein